MSDPEKEPAAYPRAVLETTSGPAVFGTLPFRPKCMTVRVEPDARHHVSIVAHDDGRIEISFSIVSERYLIKPVAANCFELIPVEDA